MTGPTKEQTTAITDAVRAILAEAEADIAARKPVCTASGRCCQFERYGHRLYVTTAELIAFAHIQKNQAGEGNTREKTEGNGGGGGVSLPQFFAQETVAGCPYQVQGLCTAREARPLGCRVYFCDPQATWQNELYERYHARLREVHDRHGLTYEYLEWRIALRRLIR